MDLRNEIEKTINKYLEPTLFKGEIYELVNELTDLIYPQPEHTTIDSLKKPQDKSSGKIPSNDGDVGPNPTQSAEHKSIEELKKEFEKKLVIKIAPSIDPNAQAPFNQEQRGIMGSADTVWNFFLPHLNSRNLLEKIMVLRFTYKSVIDPEEIHVFKDANYDTEIRQQEIYLKGYKRAVDEINSKLDEFIESEKI